MNLYEYRTTNQYQLGICTVQEGLKHPLANQMPITHSHPRRREQTLATRGLFHFLHPHIHPEQIELLHGKKPILPGQKMSLSFSHSEELCGVISSQTHRTGIDIQRPTQRLIDVQEKFIHPSETAHTCEQACLLWVVKESVYKLFYPEVCSLRDHILVEETQSSSPGTFEMRVLVRSHAARVCVHAFKVDGQLCAYCIYPH